jgi:hypothetical protein
MSTAHQQRRDALPLSQHHHPRGPWDPRLCVIVSVPDRGGAARAVPLLLGDAALAAPRTTTGPPAASPRSSMPGGEPAYADRRQQGGTDSLMSRAAVVAPRIQSQTTSSCVRPGWSDPGSPQDKSAAASGDYFSRLNRFTQCNGLFSRPLPGCSGRPSGHPPDTTGHPMDTHGHPPDSPWTLTDTPKGAEYGPNTPRLPGFRAPHCTNSCHHRRRPGNMSPAPPLIP